MEFSSIAQQIIDLKNEDLSLRKKLIERNKLSDGYHHEMEQLHIKNANQLNKIIEKIGFPTVKKVGEEANYASWLIIQHAISLPKFMIKCVELIKQQEDSLNKKVQLAYLQDRILVFQDLPQLYGTQFDWDKEGKLVPNNYDSLEKVNQRRKEIGLISLEEQIKINRERDQKENLKPPKDYVAKQKAYDLWRKKVGWLK